MRILITGSRTYSDSKCIKKILAKLSKESDKITVIHGDCQGADKTAGEIALCLGMTVDSYPADWCQYGLKAGPLRNKKMVLCQPDIVLVFHESMESYQKSKGTKGCLNLVKGELDYEPIVYFNGEEVSLSDL